LPFSNEPKLVIAETPVDEPGDEMWNVMALRALSA